MRPRTIALIGVVAAIALVMQAALVVHLAHHLMAPRQANNFAFAPAGQAFEMPDELFVPQGQPAQPVAPEELRQVRGPAVETGAYELSGPFTHANLSVFFIHGPDAMQEQRFITLQEAVSQNLAVVHDTGVSLTVDNRANLPLFIQGGDIVKGGNQDRVLPYDYLIPAGATRSPVSAFCVEAGRSFPRGDESSTSFQVSSAQLPTRSLKLAALLRRSQNDVWNGVSQTQTNLTRNLGSSVQSPRSQTSLQLTLEHPRVQQAAQAYIDKLSVLQKDNVIGFAVAINGKIESADVYASSDLFRSLWPKLLQASAVAALAEQQSAPPRPPLSKGGTEGGSPSTETLQAFLAAPEQGQAFRQTMTNGVNLIRQESAQNVLFETCSQGNLVVHRCFLAK